MSIFHDQHNFMVACDSPRGTREAELLAINLINEEYGEFSREGLFFAENFENRSINSIKEALDLIYVAAQYLNATIGPDKAEECWDALQSNNMSKCIGGKVIKRTDGKILKPEGYVKLDLRPIILE